MNKKEYAKTPIGRALYLLSRYKRSDKFYNRGIGDLSAKWIVENIFSKPCAHCGKEGWKVIGCNRLDNSKPHTKDNVEPCCKECNHSLNSCDMSNYVDQISPTDGEVVKTWKSSMDAEREGWFDSTSICRCCDGGYLDKKRGKWHTYNMHHNFLWKRHSKST